ncbi:hypothetical protein ZIOFF_035303 [Zingiber officinale]|uniref:Uncharacterized protein n=1 Tax=Zingiber officinale TaxID=94328 RepID=A0A8J5GG74_ZINOF|nr:hypothetical protein ZIOFF_035303 [Zingiber officinale]
MLVATKSPESSKKSGHKLGIMAVVGKKRPLTEAYCALHIPILLALLHCLLPLPHYHTRLASFAPAKSALTRHSLPFLPFSYLTVESKQYTPTKVGNTRSSFSLDLSMGNCMERCGGTRQKKGEESGPEKGDDGGCKVKILLTRKELEWLICVRGSENTGEISMTFNNLRFRYGINIPSIVAMASSEEMCQLSSKLEGRGVGLQSNEVEAICAEGKAAKGAVVVLRQLTSVMKLETDVID